jgi:hypothetical protein
LQIAAHRDDTAKSPMWWAMNEARGEKTVRSIPRSSISRSWLAAMLSRNSSSLIRSSSGDGACEGSSMPVICRLRQLSSAGGAVV